MSDNRNRKPLIFALGAHRVHTSQMGAEQKRPLARRCLDLERFGSRSLDLEGPHRAPNEQEPVERRRDPRYIFIESARFNVPYEVDLVGSKVGSLRQLLAKQGMWGS